MNASAPIFLDVTRLLLRAGRRAPTGIDRVELAYAQELEKLAPENLHYVVIHPIGVPGRLPRKPAASLIRALASGWTARHAKSSGIARLLRAQALLHLALFRPVRKAALGEKSSTYLNVSHQYLDKPGAIARFKSLGGRIVCLMHDLIPIEWPEFVRPAAPGRHCKRLQTFVDLADAIIFPSAATQRAARPWLDQARRPPLEVVIPNGAATRVKAGAPLPQPRPQPPYFVCLGTIEPRKNHLLLLHLWRRLGEGNRHPPRLYIVGQRGWENENILDMLDRAPFAEGSVVELASLDDAQVSEILAGARALLFPTIAEGYGLPVSEALSLGVPVLCSDLPVLREVGGDVPEYLDPFDLPAWQKAVGDYAAEPSPRRLAQLERLRFWAQPSWEGHMRQVLELLNEIRSN